MIKQARFSSSIKSFKEAFLKYWEVEEYHDINAPAIFMGCYNDVDVEAINNHKGFKVLAHTGKVNSRILRVDDRKIVFKLNNMILQDNKVNPDIYSNCYVKHNKTKMASFPIKDFSPFKPNPLGNQIYIYLGTKSRSQNLGIGIANKIQSQTSYKIKFGFWANIANLSDEGNSMTHIKETYYDNCFVNFKPNILAGYTTAIELAFMGRKTISNAWAPFCIKYQGLSGVLKIIDEESKKIGTVQSSCIGDYYDTGAEWKQVKFWQ